MGVGETYASQLFGIHEDFVVYVSDIFVCDIDFSWAGSTHKDPFLFLQHQDARPLDGMFKNDISSTNWTD